MIIIINKEFPERERERREYLFLKDEIFCIKFLVRKKLELGSDLKPSQIRYNLVILRMFEIQAPDY